MGRLTGLVESGQTCKQQNDPSPHLNESYRAGSIEWGHESVGRHGYRPPRPGWSWHDITHCRALRGRQLLWVHNIWVWPPTLRKRELGVSLSQPSFFISFWLRFVLSYMTQHDGLVGRQAGRQAGW